MSYSRISILIFTLFLSLSGCHSGESLQPEAQGNLSIGATKAASVARKQFEIFIAPEKRYGKLGLFLSDIESYTITINERADTYSITFRPRKYHGRRINGGEGLYILSKDNFSIIHEEHFK